MAENAKEYEKAKNVPPFLRWCSVNIPTAFDDSLSYYEALCALYKFIQDNIVAVVNNNADYSKELDEAFKTLKSYVDDYFTNLDVQKEVNKKLDQMVEDGTLQALIEKYFTDLSGYVNITFPMLINQTKEDTQGSCVLLDDGKNSALIDTFNDDVDYPAVKTAIQNRGITELNAIFISHFHLDHYNNIGLILDDFGGNNTVIYIPRLPDNPTLKSGVESDRNKLISELEARGYSYTVLNNYTYQVGDGFKVSAMNASATDYAYYDALGVTDYNEYSVGFEIEEKGRKFLYTSDWATNAQNRCANLYVRSNYDIMTSPHHGLSYLSTSLISKTNPKSLIISVGKGWFTRNDTNAIGSNCAWGSAVSQKGGDVVIIGYQNENIEYKFSINGVTTKSKIENANDVLIYFGSENYYLDSNSSNNIHDGSEAYPFTSFKEVFALTANSGNTVINVVNCNKDEKGIRKLGKGEKISILANDNELPDFSITNCYLEITNGVLNSIDVSNNSRLVLRATTDHKTLVQKTISVNNSTLIQLDALEINENITGNAFSCIRASVRIGAISFKSGSTYPVFYSVASNINVSESVATWLKENPDSLMSVYSARRSTCNIKFSDMFVLYENPEGTSSGNIALLNVDEHSKALDANRIGIEFKNQDNRGFVMIQNKINNRFDIPIFVGAPSYDSSIIYSNSALFIISSNSNASISRNTEIQIRSTGITLSSSPQLKITKIWIEN